MRTGPYGRLLEPDPWRTTCHQVADGVVCGVEGEKEGVGVGMGVDGPRRGSGQRPFTHWVKSMFILS